MFTTIAGRRLQDLGYRENVDANNQNETNRGSHMNRWNRILVITIVIPLVCICLFSPTPGGAYDEAGISIQILTEGKDSSQPVYLLGGENITLLLVIRNETAREVITALGFSQVELDDALIVKDPNGTRHLLRDVDDAHFMRMPYFLNDKPWAKAESLPTDWVRSVRIEDLREKLPVMNTLAGWYTISVQKPFVRYAATGQDAGLGFLGLLDHPNNWSGTLQSNSLQIYITPDQGAKMEVNVLDLTAETAQPLAQVPVRVFRNTDIPDNYPLADIWSKTNPLLSGTSDFDGKTIWDSELSCLNRDEYTVIAKHAGKYQETSIPDLSLAAFADSFGLMDCAGGPGCSGDLDRDNDVDGIDLLAFIGVSGWNVECTGLVSSRVAFSVPPVQFITITGSAYNYPDDSYRAVFSINVSKTDGISSGRLEYYFTRTRMNFISSLIDEVTTSGNAAEIRGDGTVNGNTGYTFEAQVVDANPDQFGILIRNTDGSVYYDAPLKSINGGNISLTASD